MAAKKKRGQLNEKILRKYPAEMKAKAMGPSEWNKGGNAAQDGK